MGNRLSCVKCRLEQVLALVDWVVERVLEVWIGIHADEIGGGDGGAIGSIDPRSPGVDMTNRDRAERCACNCLLDLANVVRHGRCVRSHAGEVLDTRGRFTVQIFTTDRYSRRDIR